MIAAAIDVGSNTTLALLAELQDGELVVHKDQLTHNRLGDSLRDANRFPQEIIALNVDLLNEIVRDFRRAGAEAFAICGTAAMRRATNRAEFVQAVQDILQLQIELLSGRDEAALTYAGAISSREIFPSEAIGVIDIGGGSTEVIEGRGAEPVQSTSMDIGAVYLTNEFFQSDPPTAEEVSALREHLREQLPGLIGGMAARKSLPWTLVGGTPVSLAILKRGLKKYDPTLVGGTFLSREDLQSAVDRFGGRSSLELQSLPGMPSGRGRFIHAGTVLLEEIYDVVRTAEAMVSERGLRHGLWLARFSQQDVR